MSDFANFATNNKGLWAHPTLVTLGIKSGDVSVNIKKGIIEGYLTKYFIPGTQTPVIDPYKDIVEVGAFTKTIKELITGRDTKGLDYLMPHLWQHNPNEIIGGDKWLVEDKHGVILEVQLAKGVKRADEALELIEQKMLPGISYGYDAIRAPIINGIRHLKEVALHESSSVTFPANEYAGITAVKSVFYVGGIENTLTRPLAVATEDVLETKDSGPMTFSALQDSHMYSDAMSQFFALTDMLGQSILSQMMNDAADSVQAQIDQFAVAVQAWSDEFCDVLCPPDGSDPTDSMMPTSGMGYMSAYHLSGVERLPDMETKFTPEAVEKIKHTVLRLQSILKTATKTTPQENYSIASLRDTYQQQKQAPVTSLWDRIAPPDSTLDTPLDDERYSIQSLIQSVQSALVE